MAPTPGFSNGRAIALHRAAVLLAALVSWAFPVSAEPRSAEPAPNYLRPAVEIGAGLALATVWYVVDERNVLDWDRPSIEQRLNGEAWRFDSNGMALNYVWHPLAGAGMYALARGNRLSPPLSFVYGAAGSTLWEYVIEFNEKVSINDMLVTPLAGLAAGEFFHKLALDLSQPRPRLASRQALSWTLGLSVRAHRELDGVEAALEPALWRSMKLGYGFGLASRGGARASGAHELRFDGRLVSLPGYFRAPSGGRWFHDADIASFALALDVSRERAGVDALAETLIAGYHRQSFEAGARSPAFTGTAALAVAFGYRNSEAYGFDDRQGLLHVPGLAVELGSGRGALTSFVRARALPAFGSMSSLAYPVWRRQNEGRTKTVLERESYFYGLGFSTTLEGGVSLGALALRGELRHARLFSVEGLDRAQERVARDVAGDEAELSYAMSAAVAPRALPAEFALTVSRRLRRSRLSNVETSAQGERLLFGLTLPL